MVIEQTHNRNLCAFGHIMIQPPLSAFSAWGLQAATTVVWSCQFGLLPWQ
jgi:mannitol-specific phosphotransferase system IIBC component